MQKNIKNFLYLSFFTIHISTFIKCSQAADSPRLQPKMAISNPRRFFTKDIVSDPAFHTLKVMHQEYKNAKELLSKQHKNDKEALSKEHTQKIASLVQKTDQEKEKAEFHRQTSMLEIAFNNNMASLKAAFTSKAKNLKSQYQPDQLYSIFEVQDLIKQLRELQTNDEEPIEKKYLLTKDTYDRKAFDMARKEIERKYEVFREYIRTFSKEPTTKQEKDLLKQLATAQDNYKNSWYELKQMHNPDGKETFENEQVFQHAVKDSMSRLKSESERIMVLLQQAEQERVAQQKEERMTQAQEVVTSESQQSQTNQPQAGNALQQQSKAATFSRLSFSKL